jgi:hypothetical protein
MKKFSSLAALILAAFVCTEPMSPRALAQSKVPSSPITLYSPIKHRGEHLRGCLTFQPRVNSQVISAPCDLHYGSLFVGAYHDWFQAMSTEQSRTVIKDLGNLSWNDRYQVPVVEPLAKLKPGEHRHGTIDASGAPGKPGRDGRPGADGNRSAWGAGSYGQEPGDIPGPPLDIPEASDPRGSAQGSAQGRKPKVDPLYTKALLGHLYVIHVVDESADFYALFRVDELDSGDHCTISWRVIASPEKQIHLRK